MLLHLSIRNVAIIEESSFSLKSGLNVFTGETGAGKSILIDSLLLTLGGRASADLVRTGTEEARVSALFSVGDEDLPIKRTLEEAGIPIEEDELILRRIVSANGRSRSYINERPVTVTFLRRVGQMLCEISGQHEHQHLLHPRHHLDLLDNYGELIPERRAVTQQYNVVRDLRQELEQLGGDAHNRARRRGYLQYQIDELEEADIDVDEEELEHQRKYMLQIEQMIESSQFGEQLLYSGAHSVLESLGRLQQKLDPFRELAPELDLVCKGLEEGEALIDDAARTLRNFAGDSTFNPNELEDLQEHLTQIRDLKRKHGVSDLDELKQCLQGYKDELNELDRREERMEQLETNYHKEVETLCELAHALSEKRKEVAPRLARDVEGELASLGMKQASFLVELSDNANVPEGAELDPEEEEEDEELYGENADEYDLSAPTVSVRSKQPLPSSTGYDQVQFFLSSNKGEEARAMHKVASGGELSRIMLSLKQVIAERDPVPTCIFDEVDAGIGGVTGATIGKKINDISRTRQVICITHLPQIACFADHHFFIKKMTEEGRTHSRIHQMERQEQEQEIARMMGGMSDNEQSLAHARELLTQAKKPTKDTPANGVSEKKETKKTTTKAKAKPKAKTATKTKSKASTSSKSASKKKPKSTKSAKAKKKSSQAAAAK